MRLYEIMCMNLLKIIKHCRIQRIFHSIKINEIKFRNKNILPESCQGFGHLSMTCPFSLLGPTLAPPAFGLTMLSALQNTGLSFTTTRCR